MHRLQRGATTGPITAHAHPERDDGRADFARFEITFRRRRRACRDGRHGGHSGLGEESLTVLRPGFWRDCYTSPLDCLD
jgi:hypothetical protein